MLLNWDRYGNYYFNRTCDRYLVLVSFADWLVVAIMLMAALLSLGTASILPKTSFDFIFHFVMGILILIGGFWVAVTAFGNSQRSGYIQGACVSVKSPLGPLVQVTCRSEPLSRSLLPLRCWPSSPESCRSYTESSPTGCASPIDWYA